MSSIHRVQIPVEDYQEITGPGLVISAAADRGGRSDVIDVWFETGSSTPSPTGIYIFGTGRPTPWSSWTRYAWRHVDTVVTPSGLVWHVYVGPRHGEPVPM